MPLVPGTRLGPYEIAAKVGAGGMGEVYRATDTKLGRGVAIKVLPADVARDAERLARFKREAQLLASLNHPNIAAIHGIDEADGTPFLVLELVEGEDLAERLKRGAVPADEALEIARQIAAALEEAHEKGIVHRDLKPANVKLAHDGKVKVLDFGLAKAYSTDAPGTGVFDSSNSPTLTHAATVAGMILGTAAYMSPEQARGKSVDKRADIWAFGVVLFEMLSGKQLFHGETVSDTLAAVLTREPDWRALPAGVPPRVRELLARCLRKDPKARLRDIGDARLELGESAASEPIPAAALPAVRASRGRWMPFFAAAAVVAALVGGTLVGRRSVHTDPPTFRPLTFARGFVHSARFAPDGQTLIYGAAFEGRPLALFSTRSDGFESREIDLPSADIAGISRDGQMALLLGRRNHASWLRVGTLAQVSLSGGAPREILEQVFDADLSPDGKQFAVVVVDGDDQVLQYPIGKEVFRTAGWISQPRIAPDGQRLAFVDHRLWGDDLGDVKLLQADGTIVGLAPERQYAQGLCWSPDGDEVWYSAADESGGAVWRVAPGGTERIALRTPLPVRVQDLAPDGRILLLVDESRATLAGQLAGDSSEHVYSWWDNDTATAISSDGAMYAGNNVSVIVDGEYAVFVRRAGAPPVQLGTGMAAGLTPDGKFVFTANITGKRSTLTQRPVGVGQPKTIDLGAVTPEVGASWQFVSCSSDGRRVAFVGAKPDAGRVAWVLDLDGGVPRAVSGEGAASAILSPDGSRVAVGDPRRGMYVVPAAGGDPVPVAGAAKDDLPLAWTADGRDVLSSDGTLPLRIYRTAVDGGGRELVREIVPADPAGILYGQLTLSPDGRFYLTRQRRVLSTAFLVALD